MTVRSYHSERYDVNATGTYIRMKQVGPNGNLVDDTGPRADNPDRTMLGATQLAWLKQALLDAKAAGVVWKVIAVSTPIDEAGSSSGNGVIPLDTAKAWISNYRAERNDLLKFIDDNDIHNVVFLTTDDHELPGLMNVFRKDDPDADTLRQPVDFYSPETFNYVVLDVSADGQTLALNAYGSLPHARDTFPDPESLPPSERILGFEVAAAPE